MVYKCEETYSDCDILQIFIRMMDIEKRIFWSIARH